MLGAGAIGGVVGARLHEAGHDVLLLARGPHHDAIARDGLTLETPDRRAVLSVPVVREPCEVRWTPGDVVILATKTQDSAAALLAVREAAPIGTPVVCLQNGVENERLALRLFEDVYAGVVMVPAAHLEPGVVQAYGTTLGGAIDIGRYPRGVDQRGRDISAALTAAGFSSRARADVMRFKYAKLIANLANAVPVICGPQADGAELVAGARAEGRAVLQAAGAEFVAEEVNDVRARWQRIGMSEIAGRKRAGSSTWQSLERRTGSFETDYLNGEIVLLGRLHGVATPVNALLQRLIGEVARQRRRPGSISPAEVLERVR